MSGEAYPERRGHKRLPIILEVNYRTDMEFLNSWTKNLCPGGMFIQTRYPLPEGTELNVHFAIPEARIDFSVAARVVWSVSSSETTCSDESGMGIEFLNLDPKKTGILQKYMEEKLKRK